MSVDAILRALRKERRETRRLRDKSNEYGDRLAGDRMSYRLTALEDAIAIVKRVAERAKR